MDSAAEFLAKRGFHCEKLRATITREQCCAQQRRELHPGGFTSQGRGDERTPQAVYCTSGQCVQGIRNLNLVSLGKRRAA